MAMSQSSLSGKIKTEIEALFNIEDDDILQKFCDAVSKAVYEEITQNGQAAGETVVSSGSSAGTWPTTIPTGGIS